MEKTLFKADTYSVCFVKKKGIFKREHVRGCGFELKKSEFPEKDGTCPGCGGILVPVSNIGYYENVYFKNEK